MPQQSVTAFSIYTLFQRVSVILANCNDTKFLSQSRMIFFLYEHVQSLLLHVLLLSPKGHAVSKMGMNDQACKSSPLLFRTFVIPTSM